MRLPRDLLSGTYTKPRLFLCETDKKKICGLETIDMSASLKFNAYSELTFTVPRTYTNMITGETLVNPHYNKIEALRLVYLEGFGYFEIQDPELISDGIREVKNVTAYSLEYTLAQKYLENLKINTGEVDSLEVVESNGGLIIPITLYNDGDERLSLLNIILEKIYGWKIGHVDESLKTMGRTFEISRVSVYDFIIQEICDKFNCFAVFDTIDNTINLYAEALITKHIGDGITNSFLISPPYDTLGSVSIDSYKTTAYTYDPSTGRLTFNEAPENGAKIEITDGSQENWSTDVYISFDNLAQEVNVSYSADDIKTVLTVKGSDNLDIREVNMGLPYIVDLSYYYTVEWMGQDLYNAYTEYLQNYANGQEEYQDNSQKILELDGLISYEENRLSLQYSIADNVTSDTVGTYYVRSGVSPNYYYTEVKLPDDWNYGVTYYMLSGTDLDTTKFSNFYEALKVYFSSQSNKDTSKISELKDSFTFVETYTIDNLVTTLKSANTLDDKKSAIQKFLDELWNQLGRTPLKTMYYEPYKKIKETNEEAGWNNTSNDNYWNYYPVTLILSSLELEIQKRDETIEAYEEEYNTLSNRNIEIANNALIYNHFTYDQLVRLNPFLREDEYTDDNFVETEVDSIETIIQTKKELLECGKIELAKLCEPKLEFSMNMANIYALPEFEPIVDQFQLGNLINVAIRNDYIKRARLLEVNINFDDFSDFTCGFGELTNLRTQSSIHADLLANALTAGKSVASNASYWNKASDSVTSLSLLIQKGLLDAATVIKAIDGNQGVSIDQYGIHLQKIDPVTGAINPKEGWIINNQFLYSDDNFRTTKSVFGEYTIDGQTKWGLLAEAVMAGYVAGCTIEGGIIKIGLQEDGTYAFEVRADGSVVMNGGSTIAGYVTEEDIVELRDTATIIGDVQPTNANEGQLWLNTSTNPYSLMVFTNGKWIYFSQQDGETIYITRPESYQKGDLWIVSETDDYNACSVIEEEAHALLEDVWKNGAVHYTKNGLEIKKAEYTPYENEEKGSVGNYTIGDDGLFDYHIYTSYDSSSIPDPSIMYHQGFFGSVGFNVNNLGDSITIYGVNGEIICSQNDIKYYGTDETVKINLNADSELYLIYSGGQMYLLKKYKLNSFFCEKTTSRFINGTLLKAIESSTMFNYDHWVDITPENTKMQNNIYQNFEFNKNSGLTIGQTDNAFYVNINSQEMGFYDNSDPNSPNQKVVNIGNKSATVQNAVFQGSEGTKFENNVTFEQQINVCKPDTTTGFALKIEQNGSLSLAVIS